MASTLLLLLHLILTLLSLFSATTTTTTTTTIHHHQPHPHFPTSITPTMALITPQITQACKATRFQDTCVTSISQTKPSNPYLLSPKPTTLQVIQASIWVSSHNLQTAQSMLASILRSSAGKLNLTVHATNCLKSLLPLSLHRMSSSVNVIPRGRIKDARAFMSAALTYQYDCWSELSYSNVTKQVDHTMSFLNTLMWMTSNALSMLVSYDNFGPDPKSWRPPMTERDGFWEGGSAGGSRFDVKGGFPSKSAVDVTVCKAKGCGFRRVQDAVRAAPNNGKRKFVVYIKEGVYEEIVRIPLEKKNVVFLGDGIGKTVITGSLSVARPGLFTYNTATVGVEGDGFMASGITFQNTAGPDVHQAVAFRSDSDLSSVENCEFLGNQDTLYAHSLRQYYRSCRIEGNVDFIFGNAAAIFQDCVILVRPRQVNPEHGENNAITASGRTDPAQSTGLVFQNCQVSATDKYMALWHSNPKVHNNFLGRPWKEYARTVFIHCHLEALITPQGWMPFREDFALETLYYGEYGNSGPGSDTSKRVTWSSRIPAKHVYSYSSQNFIQGNEWIPAN